jgi:hypothetical protein
MKRYYDFMVMFGVVALELTDKDKEGSCTEGIEPLDTTKRCSLEVRRNPRVIDDV